jgi:hypothetical protein
LIILIANALRLTGPVPLEDFRLFEAALVQF